MVDVVLNRWMESSEVELDAKRWIGATFTRWTGGLKDGLEAKKIDWSY